MALVRLRSVRSVGRRSAAPAEVRTELEAAVRSAFGAAGKSAEDDAAYDAEAKELLTDGGGLRYWSASLPIGKRCYLSLLPLQSNEFGGLPPTVEWEGRRLHAPAANLWAHCVRAEAP